MKRHRVEQLFVAVSMYIKSPQKVFMNPRPQAYTVYDLVGLRLFFVVVY